MTDEIITQPYAIDGVVYAIARKDQREAYVMFDTPAQANGFVEYMRRFIEKPEVASRDAGDAAPSADSDGGAIDDPFSQARLMRWGKALQAEGNSLGDALVAYADSWSQDWAEAVAPEAKPMLQDYQDSVMAMFAAVGYTEEYARQWPKEKVSVTFKRWFDEQISRAAAPPAPPAPLPAHTTLVQELSKAKAVVPVAAPPGDDGEGEYTLTFYFRNWNDLTDANVAWTARAALSAKAAPADYPPRLADEVERELAMMIDRSPEPLRRLGDWLANKLDEDDWKTAERMLLGAVESVADRAQRSGVSADPLPVGEIHVGEQNGVDSFERYAELYKEADNLPAGTKLYAAAQSQPLVEPTAAVRDVLAERQRQISAEGWTPEHDDEHKDGAMAVAAACYALWAQRGVQVATVNVGDLWRWTGWGESWFKPKDPRRDLVRAGALILAEIERLDSAASQHQVKKGEPS